MASKQKTALPGFGEPLDRLGVRPSEPSRSISDEGRKWRAENADAIEAWREWVEEHGVPLGQYRQF